MHIIKICIIYCEMKIRYANSRASYANSIGKFDIFRYNIKILFKYVISICLN